MKAVQWGYTYDRLIISGYLITIIDVIWRGITHLAESLSIIGALLMNMAHLSAGKASLLTLVKGRLEVRIILGLTLHLRARLVLQR